MALNQSIMFIFIIKGLLDRSEEQGIISSETYFVSYKDNKWGVINARGEDVISPSYQEMIIIPNSKEDVFLCTYDVNYDTGEYKTMALNSQNEEILTEYDKIEALQNYDENNNIWYDTNALKVQKDGKYGLIDFQGQEILTCEYDIITPMAGVENAIEIQKEEKYGLVDSKGNTILNTDYASIEPLDTKNTSNYIIQTTEGKYGIASYSDSLVLDAIYDGVEQIHANNMYVVIKEGKQVIVNDQGEEILNGDYDEIQDILKTTNQGIIYQKDGTYGVMDFSGEQIVPNTYDSLQEAKEGIFIAEQNGKYGIIDQQNVIQVDFKYLSIYYNEQADIYVAENENFSNELLDSTYQVKLTGILTDLNTQRGYIEISQNDEYKYYDLKFAEKDIKDVYPQNTLYLSKKDGKYGFVDKDGNVVVDYIYDDATNQNDYGYSAIKKDGKWGSIDNKGNVVVEPTYNLDDYLKIDFIGSWHYGKDINMNYYNQL